MKPTLKQPVSWLITILFAAVNSIVAFSVAWILLEAFFLERPLNDYSPEARETYECHKSIVFYGSSLAGPAVSLFAAWAFRSPAHVRFHAAFLSGFALLVITLAYVCHMRSYLDAIDAVGPYRDYGYYSVPLVTLYLVSLALILILSGFCCDRSQSNVA